MNKRLKNKPSLPENQEYTVEVPKEVKDNAWKFQFRYIAQHTREVVDTAGEYLEPSRCVFYDIGVDIEQIENLTNELFVDIIDRVEALNGIIINEIHCSDDFVSIKVIVEKEDWRRAVNVLKNVLGKP